MSVSATAGRAETIFDWVGSVLLGLLFWVAMNYVGLNMGGLGVQLPYNNFAWVLSVVFITLAALRISWFGVIRLQKTSLLYLAVLTLLLLPLAYTSRLFLDVETLRFVGMGAGLLFFIALQQFASRAFKDRFLKILWVSALIQTVWGLIQYYFIFERSWFFYGAIYGLPYGIFQQVNVFIIYVALGSLLTLYHWHKGGMQNKSFTFLAALLIFANAHLAVVSEANSAKVASFVSVVAYLVYLQFAKARMTSLVLFAAALIVGLAVPKQWVDIRPAPPPGEAPRLQDTALINSSDVSQHLVQSIKENTRVQISDNVEKHPLGTRATVYPVTLAMIMDKPWTGHGIGTFRKQYLLYQGRYLQEHPEAPAEFNIHHPHNEILYWMAELGVLPFIGFILLGAGWIRLMMRGRLQIGVLLLAAPVVAQSMFELPMYHATVHYLFFMSILYLAPIQSETVEFKLPRFSGLVIVPTALWGAFQALMFLFATYYALLMFLGFNQSGREQIAFLVDVNRPAAFKLRYEFEIFQWKLRRAVESGEITIDEINQFLMWAYSTTQYAPMVTTYENFVQCLMMINNVEAAKKYAAEGAMMYPLSERLQRYHQIFLEREAEAANG